MSSRGSPQDMASRVAQDTTMLVRRWHLLVVAAIFILGANVKGQVPDKPLLGAGGNGAKQDWGENGQQQRQRRKPPAHS